MREASERELASSAGGFVNPCPDVWGICDPFPVPWPPIEIWG